MALRHPVRTALQLPRASAVWRLVRGQLLLVLLMLFCAASPAGAQGRRQHRNPAQPIFWCEGVRQVADLDRYAASGFNTVVIHLYWVPAADGAISPNELRSQRLFANAAAQRGLKVIYALPAGPSGLEARFRIAADSEVYLALWTTWVEGAINLLKDTPGLIGWMLPDDPRGAGTFDDIGLQNWLQRNYANVNVVNKQWGAAFKDMDDISIADINNLVSIRTGLPVGDMTKDELGDVLEIERLKLPAGNAIHPAALALAQYRLEAYSALLSTWVGAVNASDPGHLLLSGRLPDYAQLLALPGEVDIAVPDMAPMGTERDFVTHNPQSIDIARRGGRFGALPVFSPLATPDLPASTLPDLVPRWLDAAWARGCVGAGFTSWEDLLAAPALLRVVKTTLGKLTSGREAGLWGEDPVNTTAIVLTPLADGVVVQHGDPPLQFPRGLFGFGENLVAGEPAELVWSMRWGTAFGGVDFLAPDDLLNLNLDRYTSLFLPQAFSVSSEMTAKLGEYAANGGAVVADLGLGALQNGGQASGFSAELGTLFGVSNAMEIKPVTFNMAGLREHPLFPLFTKGLGARPGLELTQGDGPAGTGFVGATGYSFGTGTALPIARAPEIAQDFTLSKRVWRAQLSVNEVRRGYAVFAPFRMWSYWRTGQPGFDTFHGDLMGRGALVAMAGATSLVPLPAPRKDGATLFPEMLNHSAGIVLSNHSAPLVGPQLAAVQTPGTGDWLWSNAICYYPNTQDPNLPPGRPAPIARPTDFESRTRPFGLYARLMPADSLFCTMHTISVVNTSGGPLAARIAELTDKKLTLNVWPNSPAVAAQEGEWQPALAAANAVRVTILPEADGYDFEPGSRHRFLLTDYARGADKKGRYPTEERQVQADAAGKLTLEFTGAACNVEISPAAEVTASAKKR